MPRRSRGNTAGDVRGHPPQPRALRTALANITSLRLHAVGVASWEVDVIFLQDTKLSRRGGGGGGNFFAKRGW